MLALFQLLLLLLVLPYILFAVVLIKIWEAVCTVIHPVGLPFRRGSNSLWHET